MLDPRKQNRGEIPRLTDNRCYHGHEAIDAMTCLDRYPGFSDGGRRKLSVLISAAGGSDWLEWCVGCVCVAVVSSLGSGTLPVLEEERDI